MDEEDSPEKIQPPVPQMAPQQHQEGEDGGQEEQDEYGYEGYGGEEGEEVTGALVATRLNKKKAADDAKLLANRIALLKLEEKKAWKKIEETKRKAEQVMKIRQRNDDDRMQKDAQRMQRAEEEEGRRQQNDQMKEQSRQAILHQNMVKQQRQSNEANRLKDESAKNNQMIRMQKQHEEMKNQSIQNMVRNQKMDAERRKEMERQEKRLSQRNKLINSILEENNKRMEIESMVAQLEKEEYELIQRLQNTSNIQKQAYEDLESALNNNLSPEQLEAQFGLTQQSQKKSNGGSRMSNSRGFTK